MIIKRRPFRVQCPFTAGHEVRLEYCPHTYLLAAAAGSVMGTVALFWMVSAYQRCLHRFSRSAVSITVQRVPVPHPQRWPGAPRTVSDPRRPHFADYPSCFSSSLGEVPFALRVAIEPLTLQLSLTKLADLG